MSEIQNFLTNEILRLEALADSNLITEATKPPLKVGDDVMLLGHTSHTGEYMKIIAIDSTGEETLYVIDFCPNVKLPRKNLVKQ